MIYAGFYTEILSCNPLHPIKLTMVSNSLEMSLISKPPVTLKASFHHYIHGLICKHSPNGQNAYRCHPALATGNCQRTAAQATQCSSMTGDCSCDNSVLCLRLCLCLCSMLCLCALFCEWWALISPRVCVPGPCVIFSCFWCWSCVYLSCCWCWDDLGINLWTTSRLHRHWFFYILNFCPTTCLVIARIRKVSGKQVTPRASPWWRHWWWARRLCWQLDLLPEWVGQRREGNGAGKWPTNGMHPATFTALLWPKKLACRKMFNKCKRGTWEWTSF